MAITFKINYPRPGDSVPAKDFMAFGTAPNKSGWISATLATNPGGVLLAAAQIKVRMGPRYWAVRFLKVPDGNYILTVTYSHLGVPNALPVSFTVKHLFGVGPSVQIAYPSNGATLPDPFIAYGYSTGITNIGSLMLSDTTADTTNGNAPLCGPSPWAIEVDVDPDTYDLQIFDADNPPSAGGSVWTASAIVVQPADM